MRPVRDSFARICKPLALTAVLVAAAISCGKEPTGLAKNGLRLSQGISFIPQFPAALRDEAPGTVGLVKFAKVRVVLYREDKTVALDTMIAFPDGVEEVTVNLQVPLSPTSPAAGEPLSLNLKYVNVAGDTVFKGTATVTAAPATTGTPTPQPVTIAVTYTGQGSNAADIIITPRFISATTGDLLNFTAVAVDGNGNTIANTPIKWSSLDPAVASITNAAAGAGVAGATRGTARIVAELLTGPKDTVLVAVQPKASAIAVVSGNTQTGVVNTKLALPVTVKVTGPDGGGVSSTEVKFQIQNGTGNLSSATVLTDGNGLAKIDWTLGTTAGTQTLVATSTGLTGSPVTFTATATPDAPALMSVKSHPAATAVAGATLTPVEFNVIDVYGNVATSFTGAVTAALGSSAATLGGTLSVNAVAGVAKFSTLSVNLIGTGYTIVGSAVGLGTATTNAFSITSGPAASCAVSAGNGQSATVNTALGTNPAVRIADALGNPVKDAVVTWGVTTGAGTVGSATSTSDSNGLATTTWKLGALAGAQSLTVTAIGLTGCPLVFTATATPGSATQLTVQSQPATSSTAGATLAPVVFVARDAFGNTATSFTGSVTVAIGSGVTLGGTTSIAAVGGVATFSTLTLTVARSGYALTASGSGVSSVTTAPFAIAPAAPAFCSDYLGNGETYFASTLLPETPTVLVADAFSNPVSGVGVTWAVTSGGGTLGSSSTTSNSGGFASSAWTLGSATGAQSITATCAGIASAKVFSATSLSRGMKLNVSDLVSYAKEDVAAGATVSIPIVLDLTFPEGGNLASISFDLNFDPTRFSFSKTTVGSFGTVLENTSAVGTGKISVGVFSPTKATGQVTFLYTLELVAKSVTQATSSAVTATITAAGKEDGSPASIAPRDLTITIKP